ncbi:metalloregulator ArsR/SmtB family transcription factor [Shewanella submarina]|uniref:ArsR/SmtB family transcription factor n=1 Tax=Shewanella submarina TaxID=2016376 RepID=A0ABV7GND0_9GAMM|nr:metalloregulator ArsR/SmtB family transcription factor [Shewanella submarina]MCL1036308.1 metalloregulator ArsR/SmtB family transcription factor [Shewanella submarina]
MTQVEDIAKALKELGHPIRLSIFRRLVRSGHQGLAVGNLQEELGIPGSTLSHHIASLMSAGLLSQRREGRVLYCVPEYDRLNAVIDFLQEECCQDECAPTGE